MATVNVVAATAGDMYLRTISLTLFIAPTLGIAH